MDQQENLIEQHNIQATNLRWDHKLLNGLIWIKLSMWSSVWIKCISMWWRVVRQKCDGYHYKIQ